MFEIYCPICDAHVFLCEYHKYNENVEQLEFNECEHVVFSYADGLADSVDFINEKIDYDTQCKLEQVIRAHFGDFNRNKNEFLFVAENVTKIGDVPNNESYLEWADYEYDTSLYVLFSDNIILAANNIVNYKYDE